MTRRRSRPQEEIQFARDQRATANEFEDTVWRWIRDRQVCGQKFRRQYPIPPYTADFCCRALKLILEIDGADHFTAEGRERDRNRDEFLVGLGYQVVRIAGYDVVREDVPTLRIIEEHVRTRMRELGVEQDLS